MKKILLAAAILPLMLTACNQQKAPEQAKTTDAAATTTTETAAAPTTQPAADTAQDSVLTEYMKIVAESLDKSLTAEASNSADRMFAQSVQPQIDSAIAMANLQLKNGTDPLLTGIAQKIADNATISKTLGDYLANNQDASEAFAEKEEFNKELIELHEDLMGTADNAEAAISADKIFAKNLLANHEAVVDLAEQQLKYGKDDSLKQLAQSLISNNEAVITSLKDWLKAN
ncbi:DUF305 domain-containing protein [Moraxella cuniculi]|uniref:Uncharacterized protein conserved in bacteria n=1 Tax=Moraxella cuniculi TaxID=34061 RepID=A0A3S4R0S2_9GAMM|nr:DUF305 domain-containing protein [Moraxella cuniculi]VEG12953.1 Uncharacterized protein conserved in bacteria [Moraxella cuniculi]